MLFLTMWEQSLLGWSLYLKIFEKYSCPPLGHSYLYTLGGIIEYLIMRKKALTKIENLKKRVVIIYLELYRTITLRG